MSSANLAQSLLAQAARIALSHDGEITAQERTAIRDLCIQFNIPPGVVKQVMLAIKQQLQDEKNLSLKESPRQVSTLKLHLPEDNQNSDFHHLVGMSVDHQNQLYVTDSSHHWISLIDDQLNLTILAGSGLKGHKDGEAINAQFNHPGGLTTDSHKQIYIADTENNCIRKYAKGVMSTLAGNKNSGFKDGLKTEALFNSPGDIIIDKNQNLYLSDTENHSIRCITPQGDVTTIAGNGTSGLKNGYGPSAQFKNPWGLAIDSKSNIYVADTGNHCIRKITKEHYVTTIAGNGKRGLINAQGSAARFNRPFGLTVDAQDNLYIADFFNNCIRKMNPEGEVLTFAGSQHRGHEDGPLLEARFAWPIDLTMDTQAKIYIADWANKAIRLISTGGI